MDKIVLLVEDVPKEIVKAKQCLQAQGYKVAIASNLEDALRVWHNLGDKLAAIMTDIYFPDNLHKHSTNPNGLVIVTRALLEKKPVVICISLKHNDKPYLLELIMNLRKLCGKIPLNFNKRWEDSVQLLNHELGR